MPFTAAAAAAAAARLPRCCVALLAAAIDACRLVRSRIMRSFCSALSACTVCACWRKLSSRENCLPQWHENGRSPVCLLQGREGQDSQGVLVGQARTGTHRTCLAKCSLRLNTILHSP